MTKKRITEGRTFAFLMSVIWLLFMAFPIISAMSQPQPAKTVSLLLTAVFIGLYMYSSWVDVEINKKQVKQPLRDISITVILIAIAALQFPLIGINGSTFLVFLIAHSMFSYSNKVSLILASLTLMALFIALFLSGGLEAMSMGFIGVGVYVSTLGSRYFSAMSEVEKTQASRMAVLDERERVARDVHDVLGHSLTVITLKSDLAGKLIDKDPQAAKKELSELSALARQAIAETRSTVLEIRGRTLADELETITEATQDSDIQLNVAGDVSLVDPSYRILFGWVAREAVTNILRHAQASHIRMTISNRSLSIADNGVGFQGNYGNGLTGLTDRVEHAGGTLTIADHDPGTVVTVEM